MSPAKAFLPGQYQVFEWPSPPSQAATTGSWWAMGGKERRRQGRDGLCSGGAGLGKLVIAARAAERRVGPNW